jgi:hypothetical protein
LSHDPNFEFLYIISSVYYPVILGVYSVFICERVERSVEGIRGVFPLTWAEDLLSLQLCMDMQAVSVSPFTRLFLPPSPQLCSTAVVQTDVVFVNEFKGQFSETLLHLLQKVHLKRWSNETSCRFCTKLADI